MKKKNYFYSVFAIMMAAVMSVGFTACGGDDGGGDSKKDETPTLNVTGLDAKFEADANSSASKQSMTISTNVAWGITSKPDWLEINPQSGSAGTTSVEVWPNKANSDDTEKKGEIVIEAGGLKVTKIVVQGTKIVNVSATPKDIVNLTTSSVWGFDFSGNIHHVFFTVMNEYAANNKTDVDIRNYFSQYGSDDDKTYDDGWIKRTPAQFQEIGGYFSWTGLTANTKYCLITAAYDSNNNPGKIVRTTIQTKTDDVYNSPFISYDYVGISYELANNQYFYRIKAKKDPENSAYANKFYSWTVAGTSAFKTFLSSDAIVAYLIKQEITKNPSPHDTYINGTDRSELRERLEGPVEETSYLVSANVGNDKYLEVVNWCTLSSGEFSGKISRVWANLQSESSPQKIISKRSNNVVAPHVIQFDPQNLSKMIEIKNIR